MKIRYKVTEVQGLRICETRCPFQKDRRGRSTRVASAACHGCQHFLRDDKGTMVLTCSHPEKKKKKKTK